MDRIKGNFGFVSKIGLGVGVAIVAAAAVFGVISWVKTSAQVSFKGPGSLSASVGQVFRYAMCDPAPQSPTDLCGGSFIINNPTGGKGPYHFQLETGGGVLPPGISLNLNGLLTGTPTIEGISRFSVCAVDISGSQSCQPIEFSVTVETKQNTASTQPQPVESTSSQSSQPVVPSPSVQLSPADRLAGHWVGNFTITFQGSQSCTTYTDQWSGDFRKQSDTSGAGELYDSNRDEIGRGAGTWNGQRWNFDMQGGILTSLAMTIQDNTLEGTMAFAPAWIPCLDYTSYTAKFSGAKQ